MATREVRSKVLTETLERDGEIRPSVVVADAKPRSAPLHDEFEWNNVAAANEHRLWQARRMIKLTVVKTVTDGEQHLVHVPSVVSSESREGAYKPIAAVVRSPTDFELALQEVSAKARSLASAVRDLESAADGQHRDLIPTLRHELQIVSDTVAAIRAQSLAG